MLTKLFAALLTVILSLGMLPAQSPPAEPATETESIAPFYVEIVEEVQPLVPAPLPEVPVEIQPVTTPTPETTAPAILLTAEEAESIALQAASLTREQVKFSRTEFDRDDGVPEWEVEFRHENWEYDYTIHAETGAVLKSDKEYDPPKSVETTFPATEPSVTESVTKKLTAEDAKAIALAHAGLTADQVARMKVEKDRDDGVWVYEIEFFSGRMEYEYEIHAETGKILDWDKEIDD